MEIQYLKREIKNSGLMQQYILNILPYEFDSNSINITYKKNGLYLAINLILIHN
jgi:hypothetical protein